MTDEEIKALKLRIRRNEIRRKRKIHWSKRKEFKAELKAFYADFRKNPKKYMPEGHEL